MAKAHRGKGVGSARMNAAVQQSATFGVGTLYLYSWDARRFYECRGWTYVGTFRQDDEPMALMSRNLRHIRPTT